jgi:glycosyltransferase involved in cell wall biosynthesis
MIAPRAFSSRHCFEKRNVMASPRKTRILVSSHDLRFFKPILDAWTTNPAYETLIEEHRFHEITEPRKCQEMLEQADVVFCEWCLGNAVWYSQHKKPGQKLIVRLHSQELRLPFLDQVNWSQVDRVILICPLHQKLLIERYPELETKSLLIYNPIAARTLDQPKLFGAEFNLGLLGMCPRLKAPHLAIELLSKLKSVDLRYTLFIKGKRPEDYAWLTQRPEERDYYQELYQNLEGSKYRNSVVFEGYDSNVAEWFRKIGFILSTSEREGSHQSVAEGMASGSLPIIRNWPGAELLYPASFVFGELDEAVKLVLRLKTVRTYSEECHAVKKYAHNHFDQNVVGGHYEQLLTDLSRNPGRTPETICIGSETGDGQGELSESSSQRSIVAMYVCFLTPSQLNGYAIRVMEEAHALTTHGIKVIIACFMADHPPCSGAKAEEFKRQLEERTGARCYLIPTNQFFKTKLIPAQDDTIGDRLVALANAHQVDIIHGQALYSSMHALRLRQRVSARIVFDVHGITPEEMQMSGAPPLRVSTMTECERHALQQADLRVFVSAAMRKHFRKKYDLRELDCVVPCGVHPERFAMSEEERLRKRKEIGLEGKFVFLYLGTLSVWQWPEALFAVFAQYHRARPDSLLLLLLPEGDHKQALSYCEKNGLLPGSYLLKEVPHHEVGLVAGVADAGLLLRKLHPVNAVASPTKFGEYLAAGVPVVVTEGIGDTSELIRMEEVGLVVSPTDEGLDPEDLEELLRFAEEVKAHRSDWSRRTALTASSHLGWTAGAQTLIKQYRMLVGPLSQAAPMPQPAVAET